MDPEEIKTLLQSTAQQLQEQNKIIAAMRSDAAARDEAYETLLKKFDQVSVAPSGSKGKSKARFSKGSEPVPAPSLPRKVSLPSSSSKKHPTTPQPKTPSIRTPTKVPPKPATPKSANALSRYSGPPKPSPKKHQNQLVVLETPEVFQPTKVCLIYPSSVQHLTDMWSSGFFLHLYPSVMESHGSRSSPCGARSCSPERILCSIYGTRPN